MGTFKHLYDHCQTFTVPPRISRNAIRAKAEELTGQKVSVVKVTLDTEVSRGFFLAVGNQDADLVRMVKGSNVICLARGMNRCWERLVQVKEMMHLFDKDEEKTADAQIFQNLLSELEIVLPSPNQSPQRASETKCIWMALACLCPEQKRQEYLELVEKNHIDAEGIALQLRIPKQLVPSLLHPNFGRLLLAICA